MIKTIWDYGIDCEIMPDILSEEEFNTMTSGKYAGDARVAGILKGAQDAARNYCGWHIAPSLECVFASRFVSKRISIVGNDVLVALPARFVSNVTAVEIDGAGHDDYFLESNGVLRVFNARPANRKSEIKVTYTAGLAEDMAASVASVICDRARHALDSPQGIASETTGSVSISYSSSWSNGGNASALSTIDRDVLNAFRLQGVF